MASPSPPSSPGDPNISWPLDRPTTSRPSSTSNGTSQRPAAPSLSPELYPSGTRSLSAISLRAFLLGIVCSASLLVSIYLVSTQSLLWRPTFFLSLLSLFHYLEFWTTAYANTPSAVVSSFLLSNGNAYRIAHFAALVECTITNLFFPNARIRTVMSNPVVMALGLLLVAVGQAVRSTAMLQAGTNFNHMVQTSRKEGHVLVTGGVYAYIRHPAYFGFFWWGLGTQLLVGNTICLLGYAGVLWNFFSRRIRSEESYLLSFFKEEYAEFKARTPTLIPFIR